MYIESDELVKLFCGREEECTMHIFCLYLLPPFVCINQPWWVFEHQVCAIEHLVHMLSRQCWLYPQPVIMEKKMIWFVLVRRSFCWAVDRLKEKRCIINTRSQKHFVIASFHKTLLPIMNIQQLPSVEPQQYS